MSPYRAYFYVEIYLGVEMKKINIIEILIYSVIIIFGTVMLFTYEPRNIEIKIPKDFEVIKEGSNTIDPLFE